MGHADTHFPQRMQLRTGSRRASFLLRSRMPLVPFIIGESTFTIVRPIIGPPPMILPVSSGIPPAASIRFRYGSSDTAQVVAGMFNRLSGNGDYSFHQRFVFHDCFVDCQCGADVLDNSSHSNR